MLAAAIVVFLLLELGPESTFIRGLALAVLLGGFCSVFFLIPLAIEKMKEDEGLFLREAIYEATISYIMMASFLPVVGPLIAKLLPSPKKKNPFISPGTPE